MRLKIGQYILMCGLIFLFHSQMVHWFSHINNQFSSWLVYPIIKIQHGMIQPIKGFFQARQSYKELEEEYKKKCCHHDALLAENIQLKAQQAHLNEIQEIVEFNKKYEMAGKILGQVIAKNISDATHFFLVDAGARDGVTENMIAVYKNCLVGKVTQVYPRYCKVVLITDSSCKVAAECMQTYATGIHQGCNSVEHTQLQRVSHLCAVQEGDLILSSGQGLIFPKGFALGKIKMARNEGLVHHIEVEPIINIYDISHCYLLERKT